jgi:hypothetical protein
MAEGASAIGSFAPDAAAVAGAAETAGAEGDAPGIAAATAAAIAPEPLFFEAACDGSVSSTSLSTSPGSLAVGISILVPHLGHMPFLPAKNALTLSLCPLGQ